MGKPWVDKEISGCDLSDARLNVTAIMGHLEQWRESVGSRMAR